MSSTVRAFGFIAVLTTPVPKNQKEDFQEKLYDDESDLGLTSDGKLVYFDYNKNRTYTHREEDIYGLWIGQESKDPQDLVNEATKYGLSVDPDTIQYFNCIWYNGGDCPVWELTEKKYRKQISGK